MQVAAGQMFQVNPVSDRAEYLDRNLLREVGRHRQPQQFSHVGEFNPLCDAPNSEYVELHDVYALTRHEGNSLGPVVEAFTCSNWDAKLPAEMAIIVKKVCLNRLFEPRQAQTLELLPLSRRLLQRPLPVCVYH